MNPRASNKQLAAPRALLSAALLSFGISLPPVLAQDSETKSQEQWLRYSNWEHRSQRPLRTEAGKPQTSEKTEPSSDKNSAPHLLPLPEHPGSQTVDGVQATIPGWAFQQPQQAQRPAEIIINGNSFGSTPSYQSRVGLSPYVYGPGLGSLTGAFGAYPRGWSSGLFGGSYRHGWGGFGSGWGGLNSSWGGLNYGLGGLSPYGIGAYSAYGRSRLGPQVIQTGQSPASGNYYQPSTGDSSASGNYYASGAPWQVPINAPNNPKDYWGPSGSPFKY